MNKDCKNIVMLYENAMQRPTMTVDRYGNKIWMLNGKRHREDGPAIEWADGSKSWFLNDMRHREDGPADEWADGSKSWYLNDMRHREDGPAIVRADGHKSWFLHNKKYENVYEWTKALLELKGNNNPSEDDISDVMQRVTSSSILD